MSQQRCITSCVNHIDTMINAFKNYLSTEAMVDVTLACDGMSLKAHKIVLSAFSPFFQSLFLENPHKHPIVILKDMKYAELKAIIEFIYHGKVNVAQDQLSALMKAAETLQVKGFVVEDSDLEVIWAGVPKLALKKTAASSQVEKITEVMTPLPKQRSSRTRKRSMSDQSDDADNLGRSFVQSNMELKRWPRSSTDHSSSLVPVTSTPMPAVIIKNNQQESPPESSTIEDHRNEALQAHVIGIQVSNSATALVLPRIDFTESIVPSTEAPETEILEDEKEQNFESEDSQDNIAEEPHPQPQRPMRRQMLGPFFRQYRWPYRLPPRNIDQDRNDDGQDERRNEERIPKGSRENKRFPRRVFYRYFRPRPRRTRNDTEGSQSDIEGDSGNKDGDVKRPSRGSGPRNRPPYRPRMDRGRQQRPRSDSGAARGSKRDDDGTNKSDAADDYELKCNEPGNTHENNSDNVNVSPSSNQLSSGSGEPSDSAQANEGYSNENSSEQKSPDDDEMAEEQQEEEMAEQPTASSTDIGNEYAGTYHHRPVPKWQKQITAFYPKAGTEAEFDQNSADLAEGVEHANMAEGVDPVSMNVDLDPDCMIVDLDHASDAEDQDHASDLEDQDHASDAEDLDHASVADLDPVSVAKDP